VNRQRRVRKLEALYAELPKLDCQGKCAESCGPIFMTEIEWERITDDLGHTPEATSLTCPMLTAEGRCSVYELRPTICRLWGLVERMACPWGCVPERWLTDAEAGDFLRRAGDLGTMRAMRGSSTGMPQGLVALRMARDAALAAYERGTYPAVVSPSAGGES
jgi:hypothetical protein